MEKQPYFNIGDIPETSALKERIMLPFRQLNWLLNGLVMDRITLITSSTDSGKTTVCSQFILNAIKQGYKTFYFAGEDSEDEARDRIYKQYTSFSEDNFKFVQYIQNGKATNCGEYILSHEKFEEAKNFFDNKLFIHNNSVPANKEGLINTIEQARIKEGCRFFVLDNVEIFDLDSDNENNSLKEICVALRNYAITKKVHIAIVSHIRKIERNICRPDIFDVKGTSSLTNISKNIITIIRTDKLDTTTKEYKNFEKVLSLNGYCLKDCDCVVEVRKTKGRGLGFCCLKFNKCTQSYYETKEMQEIEVSERPILSIKTTEITDKDEQEIIDSIF